MGTSQAPGKAIVAVLAGLTAIPAAVLAGTVLAGTVLAGTVLATTVLTTTVLAETVLAGPAVAATGGPARPAPKPSRHPAGRAPAAPQLTISLSDGRKSVQPGQRLTYTVLVSNGGSREQHLKITQTLPPGLRLVSASRNGLASRGLVTWRSGIPARGNQTLRLVAQVTRTPARVAQLASVACAATAGSGRPLVCAAALNRLPASAAAASTSGGRPSGGRSSGWAAVAWTCLAVLAVGLVVLLGRRHGRGRRLGGAS